MFKKLILLLIVIAPMSMFAQDKIAYINANEIFSKMPELKDVETKLAAKSETIKKNAAAIEAEYTKKVEEFQKDTTNLTESILLDRQTQLDGLRDRYQNFIQTSQAEFEKEQQTLITPIQQKMRQAIKEVGDENNYAYILDAATLLHIGSHATDASKMVKTKLGITD
ncbi:MAG: OmpH family outer membrane protein [Prevotella sp.]|uniref:OmpH family outer membrane protein n=1 Tax=unclassified Dysgonomonas TaxID=2630389 RepID=UPI0025C6C331|nr:MULTISPECIES: OmpH family outer membrane protein [unclassified Dysgonomonas]MDR1716984.1 OmpH family outer membrane protein [Prevotella sp.]MDR2003055.1 OmpH family outer membrane protein [Prevotella sp.]HMM04501.1 OmpH family outer membrane protein [Dysgonomonas sp.]